MVPSRASLHRIRTLGEWLGMMEGGLDLRGVPMDACSESQLPRLRA